MKKTIVILIVTGFALVGVGFYFAQKSLQDITNKEEKIKLLDSIADDKAKIERAFSQLQNNTINYQHLELNQYDYNAVYPCLQEYINKNNLPSNCDEQLLRVVIDDFGEVGMVNAIVGEAIDFTNLSFNTHFINDLFQEEALLKSKLILSFLNKYRNAERLQHVFNKYRNHIYKILPKSVYEKVFDKQLTACIAAYNEIKSKPDEEAFFKDIYFKADTQNLHGKYWNITFWKRRALEKNDTMLYSILKEIKIHYNQVD